MNSKLFGGILLILGTAIGAGMLALPITTVHEGFITSVVILLCCSALMMLMGLYLLEVCLWLPKSTNLVSMSRLTLGRFGAFITWFFYLLLLYSIICAYITGTADLLQMLFRSMHIIISDPVSTVLVVIIFGAIAYRGIQSIDHINRWMTITLFIVFFLLFSTTAPHIDIHYLWGIKYHVSISTLMIMFASLAFSIIIPSLRNYLDSNVKKLKIGIVVGCFIPTLLYILWIASVQGIIPEQGLITLSHAPQVTSAMTNIISTTTHHSNISDFVTLFAALAILTSLLGVSVCMPDFIQDGFKLKHNKQSRVLSVGFSFIPPLIIVLAIPGLFVKAVEYAGLCCFILLVWIPALMVFRGRYHQDFAKNATYQVFGGKFLVVFVIILSTALIFWSIGFDLHVLPF